jgi:hypothetical protein
MNAFSLVAFSKVGAKVAGDMLPEIEAKLLEVLQTIGEGE